jgi:PAS domain S-box-containing protein
MLIQEDYFRNIFNTVREGIIILDEDMRVLSANRSFFNIFKVDAANTIGSFLYDLGNGQWNIPYLRVLLEDILPKNDTVDDYEIEHNFESIGQKTMLLNACKIREKKNDQPIIFLAIEDITDRKLTGEKVKNLNAMLERNNAQLTEANKDLEAFSYSVSHDLRAPLRHMSGFVDLLQKRLKDYSDEKTLSYAASISGASNKMSMLIDDLLAFSHIGRMEMQKRRVNMNALVSEVVREIQDELKERKIRWDIEELPEVLGDRALLRLVIVNLVSNAVKFTSTRPQAEIKIGCKDEGVSFSCSVADNGVGFDMQYVDKLFGVFQRLHTKDEFEGTGIGLANVQRIIFRHGGRVWAEGAVGQGATFYFTLPKTMKA